MVHLRRPVVIPAPVGVAPLDMKRVRDLVRTLPIKTGPSLGTTISDVDAIRSITLIDAPHDARAPRRTRAARRPARTASVFSLSGSVKVRVARLSLRLWRPNLADYAASPTRVTRTLSRRDGARPARPAPRLSTARSWRIRMSAPTARAADGKRYTYEWYVVVICMLAYVFSFVDRQVLVLMIEPIKRDLHLTDTQFSLLNGFAFSLFYAVMGLPVAYLADRYARPRIIALGIALWSVATAACGLSQQFVQMFVARMGVGVGEAALSPGAYSMLADYFPKEKLGRAIAVYSLGSFIGGGVAFLIGGYVIALLKHASAFTLPLVGQVHAWQVTFLIVGLPGILVALLFAATVRDPQRKGLAQDRSGAVRRVSMRDSLRFVGTHRATFSCHYLGFSFYAMTLYCLLSWTPAFYIRHFGMTAVEAGYTLGIVLLVANTAGVFCGGWLNDWLLRRGRSDAPMRAGAIGAACMVIPATLFTQLDSLPASLAMLVVAMFFASFPMPTSTAAMQTLAPNQMRAQISALFLLVSNLIALGIGTTVVALFTDRVFGAPAAVGHSMSIVNVVAATLAALLLAAGCRQYRRSLERERGHAAASASAANAAVDGGNAVAAR